MRYTDPSGHALCIYADCGLVQSEATGNVIVRDVGNSTLYAFIASAATGTDTAEARMDALLSATEGFGLGFLGSRPRLDRGVGHVTRTHFRGLAGGYDVR